MIEQSVRHESKKGVVCVCHSFQSSILASLSPFLFPSFVPITIVQPISSSFLHVLTHPLPLYPTAASILVRSPCCFHIGRLGLADLCQQFQCFHIELLLLQESEQRGPGRRELVRGRRGDGGRGRRSTRVRSVEEKREGRSGFLQKAIAVGGDDRFTTRLLEKRRKERQREESGKLKERKERKLLRETKVSEMEPALSVLRASRRRRRRRIE